MEIEKNVPIPPKAGHGISEILRQMEIGDSVVCPDFKATNAFAIAAKRQGRKITRRGLRIWRTA